MRRQQDEEADTKGAREAEKRHHSTVADVIFAKAEDHRLTTASTRRQHPWCELRMDLTRQERTLRSCETLDDDSLGMVMEAKRAKRDASGKLAPPAPRAGEDCDEGARDTSEGEDGRGRRTKRQPWRPRSPNCANPSMPSRAIGVHLRLPCDHRRRRPPRKDLRELYVGTAAESGGILQVVNGDDSGRRCEVGAPRSTHG